jgi:uncharacterized repeat protein (TIGR02543 family)
VKTVSVTLNANGGDAVPGTTVTYAKTYGTGTLGALPMPVRDGYKFLGWYTAKSNGTKITDSTKVTKTSATQELYAHWQAAVKVTLDTAGGDALSPNYRMVKKNATVGTLPTPVREGYVFKGWYTAGGSKVTASTKVSANATYYAHWIKDWAY